MTETKKDEKDAIAASACNALLGRFEVRQRKDGRWCIFHRKYNVAVAVFSENTSAEVQLFKKALEAA